jgi:predicted Holliday junction resolvase-like endonuclease
MDSQTLQGMLVVLGLLVLVLLIVLLRVLSHSRRLQSSIDGHVADYRDLQSNLNDHVRRGVAEWRERELSNEREGIIAGVRKDFMVQFEQWKVAHEVVLRKDAISRSRSVITGKIFEQLVPYLPHFRHNPKDARFIGSPIDFLVFDGLNEDRCDQVVFVEVKTGESGLSTRERRVRDAVQAGRVQWEELRIEMDSAVPSIDEDTPSSSLSEVVSSMLDVRGDETLENVIIRLSPSEDPDPMFREAAEACLQNQGGSTSLLQRKLRIGYGRAARIIDELCEAGILGPPDGSKAREVLIGVDQLDEYCR